MPPWWRQPFFEVALPIIIAFVLTYWAHNRRIDNVNRRIGDVNRHIEELKNLVLKRLNATERRLERIEQLLADHGRRITVLEERTSPLRP